MALRTINQLAACVSRVSQNGWGNSSWNGNLNGIETLNLLAICHPQRICTTCTWEIMRQSRLAMHERPWCGWVRVRDWDWYWVWFGVRCSGWWCYVNEIKIKLQCLAGRINCVAKGRRMQDTGYTYTSNSKLASGNEKVSAIKWIQHLPLTGECSSLGTGQVIGVAQSGCVHIMDN